ncbi:MAG: adenosylcobinamide-GDP ribazoletransferase [Methylobacter sp.]|nr:adenosylcobinamide-GDP ribazoletransferase [Methylobacter sp.]
MKMSGERLKAKAFFSFPRSSVGMQLAMLRRRVRQRWSVAGCVPTPERGTDKQLFLLALSFYTRLPHPKTLDYKQLPQAAVYLPLVGWLAGGSCAVVFYLADLVWPQTTAVILALSAGILMTGALHEDGFADVCDGFGGGMNKLRILEIMKDSHIGVYGVIGLLLILLLKISVLTTMPAAAVPSVLLTGHSISRLSPLLLMQRYTYAREHPSKASDAVYQPTFQELTFSAVIALLPLALLPVWCAPAIISVLVATIFLGRYFYRHIGGYTGDCLGASQQVAETVFYLSVSALWIFI